MRRSSSEKKKNSFSFDGNTGPPTVKPKLLYFELGRVVANRRIGALLPEVRVAVELVAAEELVAAAGIPAGARLGDDVDDAAARARPLGRVARGDDLELLDRFERRRREQRDVAADVDVHDAVDEPVDGVAARAVHRDAHHAGQADADFVGEIARHARRQLGELGEVAVVDRQLLHLLRVDQCSAPPSWSGPASWPVTSTTSETPPVASVASSLDAIVDGQGRRRERCAAGSLQRERHLIGADRQQRQVVDPFGAGRAISIDAPGRRVLEARPRRRAARRRSGR